MSILKLLCLLCLLAQICSANRPTRRRIEIANVNPHDYPPCGDNQVLTVRAGVLTCVTSVLSALPSCGETEVLTARSGVISCVDEVQPSDLSSIDNSVHDLESSTSALQLAVSNLQTQVNQLLSQPQKASSSAFIGLSAYTTGSITDGGSNGILAASSICKKAFPANANAHMCTTLELYASVASGVITNNQDIIRSWVYAVSNSISDPSQTTPGTGENENCGGYTYSDPLNAYKWFGTTVEWKKSQTGVKSLQFLTNHYSSPTFCSNSYPISCCA